MSNKFTGHQNDNARSYAEDRDAKSQDTLYATSNGAPHPHPYGTQRAGENGPLLLQDFHLIDLISHFDRERVPERVVHAKGSGAHGFFECTNAIPELTVADLFSQKGKKCPLSIRFSTVGGESGSHDCARDPRGFAVKFRIPFVLTQLQDEGNWDLVGNNTPVFFLRDPAKFPHFIHTQKRHPATHLSGGDDSTMFWDYLSQNPEAVHQVMILFVCLLYLLSPSNFHYSFYLSRHMNGYSGHTLKFINKEGEWVYVQLHWKTNQGIKWIPAEEANNHSPDHSQKDLYYSIEKGDFPSWTLFVQTMTPKEAEDLWEKQKINVFDLTHVWPQKQFPLKEVGRIVLDENAKNYFAEIEQIAFSPSHLVPGIEPSADPVLQSRLFSYPDTHGTNYQQLPVNAPRCPFRLANFQRDGAMAFNNQGGRANYLSSIEPIPFKAPAVDIDKTHGHFIGNAVSYLSSIRTEDFNAPRALWERVFDEGARERFIKNISGHMGNCHHEDAIKRMIAIFGEVSPDMKSRLEKATGITGHPGIKDLAFNGTHNGMEEGTLKVANNTPSDKFGHYTGNNNAGPRDGTHKVTKQIDGKH
ncbi:Catalase [Dactylellina cionopaga]|nr:Catalase [Dactylellina cionopaga]